jgi:hypothetical protein
MAVLYQLYYQIVIKQQTQQWFQNWKIVLSVRRIKWNQVPAVAGMVFPLNRVIGAQPLPAKFNKRK